MADEKQIRIPTDLEHQLDAIIKLDSVVFSPKNYQNDIDYIETMLRHSDHIALDETHPASGELFGLFMDAGFEVELRARRGVAELCPQDEATFTRYSSAQLSLLKRHWRKDNPIVERLTRDTQAELTAIREQDSLCEHSFFDGSLPQQAPWTPTPNTPERAPAENTRKNTPSVEL